MSTPVRSSVPAVTVRGTLREGKLRALLNGDREAGNVVASRGGKISRRHYARLLGCTPSALTRFVTVFAEYERALGIAAVPMRRFPEMRERLNAAYEARELDIRGGKLDRTAFARHFELSAGTFVTRHTPIRTSLEEFDARPFSW